MSEPWERQKRETAKSYEGFCIYRDLGSERSLVSVAKTLGKSNTWVIGWSSKYDWVERARHYDNYLDQKARKEFEKEIIDTKKRHAQIVKNALNLLVVPVQTLIKKLSNPLELQKLENWELDKLLFYLANNARTITELIKLERLFLGLSTENVEGQMWHSGTVKHEHTATISDEDRGLLIKELRAEQVRRLNSGNGVTEQFEGAVLEDETH